MPRDATSYEQDYRWTPEDNLRDVVGFFYTAGYDDDDNVTSYSVHYHDRPVNISSASNIMPIALALVSLLTVHV